MILKVLSVGPLQVNCSLVVDTRTGKALVVDPGAEGERILEEIGGLEVVGIVNTHGHVDHTGQVAKLRERLRVPFYIHPDDLFLLRDEIWPGFSDYIEAQPCPEPDEPLSEGMEIRVGTLSIRVLHTPGHTPGTCCLLLEKERVLIAGDLIFKGSVGRWDLPGGDRQRLMASLRRVLTEIPEDTLVVCGHYEETTIGYEKQFNPYIREVLE